MNWRSGFCTDVGRVRTENEDRLYVDDERGIFLVADGVGGQAAGEMAAEVATDVIRAQLSGTDGDLKDRIRRAITEANNTIFAMAQDHDAWHGMACVLTLAALDDDRFVVGHVGDSRLYLIWNGAIRKLTSDHSPVGEMEERGELTEQEAMLHPRRNEVFRDVGSKPRSADEDDFIELKEFLFKPDAAVLLCSDGLSDVLTSSQISEIIEGYDGEPNATASELVAAANECGGADNITAIFVAGSEFLGSASEAMAQARERHAITRTRQTQAELRRPLVVRLLTGRVAFLIYGLILGLLVALRWK
jgi:PPM family protein phosphatase